MRRRRALVALAGWLALGALVPLAAPAAHAAPVPTLTPAGFLADPEGDTGSMVYELPVHLSEPTDVPVSVDWATIDGAGTPGLAQAGTDFVAASGTVTFAPGETVRTVPIEIVADTDDEAPLLWGEWGLVAFSNPSNATLDTATFYGAGLFIIIDDDVLPTVLPGGASITEGDSGSAVIEVPVTLSEPSAVPVTVEWATVFVPSWSDVAARPGSDYEATGGVVTFAPGETVQTAAVTVIGDEAAEADELVVLAFGNPTNAVVGGFGGLGFGGIVDNDQPPVVDPGSGAVAEGDEGTVVLSLPVTLSRPYSGTVTVDWEAVFVTGAPNQADPGVDYVAASGTVAFAPGDTAHMVSLTVIGDTDVEPDETVLVIFSNPVNATLGRSILDQVGFATIANDD